jgi:hypothetical protein
MFEKLRFGMRRALCATVGIHSWVCLGVAVYDLDVPPRFRELWNYRGCLYCKRDELKRGPLAFYRASFLWLGSNLSDRDRIDIINVLGQGRDAVHKLYGGPK